MDKVNIREKFGLFQDHWHPRIVAELNGQEAAERAGAARPAPR